MLHALLTDAKKFQLIADGKIFAEIVKDSRPFQIGEEVVFQEYDEAKQSYTGRELPVELMQVVRTAPRNGLYKGFVLLAYVPGTVKETQLPIAYAQPAPAPEATVENENGANAFAVGQP